MPGLPIRDISKFLELLELMNNSLLGIGRILSLVENKFSQIDDFVKIEETGNNYGYTWDNYSLSLEGNIPQQIVFLDQPGVYYILIENLSCEKILLHLGSDGLERLTVDNSALVIEPRASIEIKDVDTNKQKYEFWAISSIDIKIAITILSNGEKSSEPEGGDLKEMPAPLEILMANATGEKYSLPLIYSDRFDSQLGIDGYNAFAFSSYDLKKSMEKGYGFSVSLDPSFTTLDYNGEFIQLHRVSFTDIYRLILTQLAYIRDYQAARDERSASTLTNTWVAGGRLIDGELKYKNVFATHAENETLLDEIIIKPGLFDQYYIFRIKVVGGLGFQTAVFDYDKDNQAFHIKGY